ncbi:MAG: formate/nitrite transporter family protein [Actinomycetota bacterium]
MKTVGDQQVMGTGAAPVAGRSRSEAEWVAAGQLGDAVAPRRVVEDAVQAAVAKDALSVSDLLLRGFLSGMFLGIATSLAFAVKAQPLPPIAAAVIVPVGFVMLVLLGLELVTGSFAIMPMGVAARRVTLAGLGRNWVWVYLGNLAGCLLFAAAFYAVLTSFGHIDGGPVAAQIKAAGIAKTIAYQKLGATGWLLALIKGILANWMVTVAVLLALASRSTIGKITAMWIPILVFFALGFEHSVVNMFVVPMAMMLKAPISTGGWWWWNQIPVTIGNIIGGAVLTGLALYFTLGRSKREA